jgi:hypothetical protein
MRRGLLFAGTENSVWVSSDDGQHWTSLQLNLPHTSMRDLVIHDQDLVLATHGRSFWVLDNINPLRQAAPSMAAAPALLQPSHAVRVRRSTGSDTPIQPDEPAGRNPPNGAMIDYFLPRAAPRPVTIEILDARGDVVSHASSDDPPPYTEEQLERELIPNYWIRMPSPPAVGPGMHRWVWDLHYTAPRTVRKGFPISAVPGDTPQEPSGPLANPGSDRVRLSLGKFQSEAPLVIDADPRVKIGAADFAAQFALSQRLASGLDSSTEALLEARSLLAQLPALRSRAAADVVARLHALEAHVDEVLKPGDGNGTPQRGLEALNGAFETLYEQVTQADALPTTVQAAETDRCVADWQVLRPMWQRLRNDEVADLNTALRKARLPMLRPELPAPRDLEMADEE